MKNNQWPPVTTSNHAWWRMMESEDELWWVMMGDRGWKIMISVTVIIHDNWWQLVMMNKLGICSFPSSSTITISHSSSLMRKRCVVSYSHSLSLPTIHCHSPSSAVAEHVKSSTEGNKWVNSKAIKWAGCCNGYEVVWVIMNYSELWWIVVSNGLWWVTTDYSELQWIMVSYSGLWQVTVNCGEWWQVVEGYAVSWIGARLSWVITGDNWW